MNVESKKLLTVSGAARLLHLSESTIRNTASIPRHHLPGIRAIRFDPDELLEWAKSQGPNESRAKIRMDRDGWLSVEVED